LAAVVACFLLAAPALGQRGGNYPPPPPGSGGCAQTGVIRANGKFKPQKEFRAGARIVVRGHNNCADPNATVLVSIDAEAEVIGTGSADAQGSYLVEGTIPPTTSSGTHTIIVTTSGERYEAEIEVVVEEGSQSAGAFGGTAGPLLVAWVALAGVVGAFFVGSRRRRREVAIVAAEETPVPLLDTSSFVPFLPERVSGTHTHPSMKKATKAGTPKKKSPATKRRIAGSAAKRKPKSAAPKHEAAKRTPVKTNKGRSATTKRAEPGTPRRPASNAKPKRRQRGGGPQA
jgi:hypothetical protein